MTLLLIHDMHSAQVLLLLLGTGKWDKAPECHTWMTRQGYDEQNLYHLSSVPLLCRKVECTPCTCPPGCEVPVSCDRLLVIRATGSTVVCYQQYATYSMLLIGCN